jgi:hypothetical protein
MTTLPIYTLNALFLAAMTSMNIAEICGLRWKRLNLTETPIIMDAELLPALTAGVREQYYKGAWGSVKAKARRRNVFLPRWVVTALTELRQREHWVGPEDPVFAGSTGKPICENAIVQRHLKPAGAKLDMPWLSWHDLRRTFATLAGAEKMSIGERKELMGHSRAGKPYALPLITTSRWTIIITASLTSWPGRNLSLAPRLPRWRSFTAENALLRTRAAAPLITIRLCPRTCPKATRPTWNGRPRG